MKAQIKKALVVAYALVTVLIATPAMSRETPVAVEQVRMLDLKAPEITFTYSEEDLYYLSRTIWAEARGEGERGMIAVGSVILNRTKSGKFPDTIKAVCLEKAQFSVWSKHNPNRKVIFSVTDDNETFAEAEAIAKQLLISGPSNRYLYFESRRLGKAGHVIGNHRFR